MRSLLKAAREAEHRAWLQGHNPARRWCAAFAAVHRTLGHTWLVVLLPHTLRLEDLEMR